MVIFFFFFSSRRRHTRYWRDWSSDVCSSDLKFYGHDKYWSNIYAANLNTVSNAYYTRKPSTAADIYPGQKLVIPSLPSGYRVWVVLRGDSLRYLAQRFYGNGNKWKRIYDANRNVIRSEEHTSEL